MPSIPDTFIDDLVTRVDLHDLIGRYITLKKAGNRYMGVCPFHGDSNPSLSVTPDKGFWYCFGCQEGGDAITFIRKQENLDFVEAVQFIARLYGIPVPETVSDPQATRRRKLIDVNDAARDFYVKVLKSKYGRPYRDYLVERGFIKETVLEYRLGASLPGWDNLSKYLVKKGFEEKDLIDGGVSLPRKGGRGLYDRFRGRLMIPIVDTIERTLGFGARAMGNDEPKYINSPESRLFQKSKVLFGLDLAKSACRESGQLIVMEGYTDVMHAHQAGVRNACAVMGTALTGQHLPLLTRFAGNVTLAFDGDEAGIRATTRSLMTFAGSDLTVKVLPLPAGTDPADVIRSEGAEKFRERVKDAPEASGWLFRTYGEPARTKSLTERIRAFEEVAEYLHEYRSHPVFDELQEKAAIAFNINLSALRGSLRSIGEGKRFSKKGSTSDAVEAMVKGGEQIEKTLFLSLMKNPSWLSTVREQLDPEDFDNPLHRRLARIIFSDGFSLGSPDGLLKMREITDDGDLYSYVLGFAMEYDEDSERGESSWYTESDLKSCLRQMLKRNFEAIRKDLQGEMSVVQKSKGKGWEEKLVSLQGEMLELEDEFRELLCNLGGEKTSREEEICQ